MKSHFYLVDKVMFVKLCLFVHYGTVLVITINNSRPSSPCKCGAAVFDQPLSTPRRARMLAPRNKGEARLGWARRFIFNIIIIVVRFHQNMQSEYTKLAL